MAAEDQTMAQQPVERNPQQGGAHHVVGEWFWRFLAVVMVATVGWVVWIAYQISPPAVFTPAAFQAAAKARALHSSASPTQGAIKGKPAPAAQPASAAVSPATPSAAPAAAPVNLEKLRLFDTLETPVADKPAAKTENAARK